MERTDDMASDVRKAIIIMRGIRADLISPDEALKYLLNDMLKDPLYYIAQIVVNRYIMGEITDEQKQLFMDYHGAGAKEDDQETADQIDAEDVYADIHDLIMEADDEPDWPSY